ncbi:hypothetical protein SAMN05443144_12833 [Fodinibius roseus]|uniref:Uncharacterized protein n=1 Tax=Fodinibius roseus TaxID=1194090 RepID=A0A1M5JT95_9BACT|nr:hypothetical protein SAMN05443144_12833 [Fodinibius roseus]
MLSEEVALVLRVEPFFLKGTPIQADQLYLQHDNTSIELWHLKTGSWPTSKRL